MSNALQEQEPSNLVLLKVPAGKQPKKLPKGITKQGKIFHLNFQFNGQRHKKSAETDSLTVAKERLVEFKAAVQGGTLFENKNPNELMFKDFAIESAKSRAGKHGYTFEDVKVFLCGDKKRIEALRLEVQSQEPPRFNFSATYNYFGRFNQILKYFGDMPVKKVCVPATITEYLSTMPNAAGNTKKNLLNVISAIFNFANESGTFDDYGFRNPYRKGLHKQRKADPVIHYWTVQKRAAYLKAAEELGEDLFFPYELAKDMTELYWLLGGRARAILTLKVGKIDLNEGAGTVKFPAFRLKGARYISQHIKFERAREILLKYSLGKSADDFLFTWDSCHKRKNKGNGVEYWSFNKAFKVICYKAGIEDGANIHSLKKTYGMERVISGAGAHEVQRELQHVSYDTTEKHYLDEEVIIEETAKRLKLPVAEQERLKQGYTPQTPQKVS